MKKRTIQEIADFFDIPIMNDFERNMYQEICMLREKVSTLKLDNAQLKEQLRWRPGSENPEKDGDYLGKWSDYSEPVNLVYRKGKWFMFEDESPELVPIPQPKYWLPIPPLEV